MPMVIEIISMMMMTIIEIILMILLQLYLLETRLNSLIVFLEIDIPT